MANYDQMAAAVKELSGGKNIVLLDDMNLPSIYVPINRLKMSELISGGSENVHPAFSVNGVEKDTFYYSKYQNIIINGRAYSLAHRDPAVNINFDNARQACEAKGAGFHLSTLAEWACIALWCRKNKTMPHGNSNYGRDEAYTHERGQESAKDNNNTGRTFTGSGPATWGHDWTQFGVQDMKGNVWEWQTGARLMDGQINIIPYNNAAMGSECDVSASSTLWKAITADGSLVAPSTANTLHYDWISNKITLIPETSEQFKTDAGEYSEFANIVLGSGLSAAPELAKALLLFPEEPGGDYGGDGHWIDCAGERLPICGGNWDLGAGAGVFYLDLGNLRSSASGNIGFRSAYVSL